MLSNKAMSKQIQVSDEVHAKIFDFILDYHVKNRKRITINDAINMVFDHYNECVEAGQ
jgi:hypothetical protein